MKAAAHAAKFPSQPSQKSHSVNQMSGGALINLCHQPGGRAAGSGQVRVGVQGTCRCQSVNSQCMRPSVCQSVSQLVKSVKGQQWSYRVGQTGSGIALAPPTAASLRTKTPDSQQNVLPSAKSLVSTQHQSTRHARPSPGHAYSPRILLNLRSRPLQTFTLIPNNLIPHMSAQRHALSTVHGALMPQGHASALQDTAPLPSAAPPMRTPACCCRPCIVIGVVWLAT